MLIIGIAITIFSYKMIVFNLHSSSIFNIIITIRYYFAFRININLKKIIGVR